MECVDLFSGIGGIALGLREFVSVSLYCEWDAGCAAVLAERMATGDLDPAPIHGDIQTLKLPKGLREPVMICGGFPCQDISGMGLQRGVAEGNRSGMFFQIMRLVDENPAVSVLFLENVANILNVGLHEVVEALVKRGFRMQWIVRSASELGAPHVRARWFCLAIRYDTDVAKSCYVEEYNGSDRREEARDFWKSEPCPRVLVRENADIDPKWSARCMMLGNAVVPAVVREAFAELAAASAGWSATAACLASYATPVSTWLVGDARNQSSFPESAIVCDGKLVALPPRPSSAFPKHTVDTSYEFGGTVQRSPHWPTPRRTVHASSLTARSTRDLPTLLVHCKASAEYLRTCGVDEAAIREKPQGIAIPNVKYIEWMMGYRADWTKVPLPAAKSRSDATMAATQKEPTYQVEDNRVEIPVPSKKSNINGMHVFMREHPGNDIRVTSGMWKALSDDERKRYTETAKQIRQDSMS